MSNAQCTVLWRRSPRAPVLNGLARFLMVSNHAVLNFNPVECGS